MRESAVEPTSGGGEQSLTGYLNILKPPASTSFGVVARIRRLTGQRRVGHAGTLDPAAVGVLPVALGRATTTLASQIWDRKLYWADIAFGTATDTDDAEGRPIATGSPAGLSAARVSAALTQFLGEIEQRPPVYSAVQVGGRRAYVSARRGDRVSLAPRRVRVDAIALTGWRSPLASILVQCGSGTYIRAIARDLGEALGCPAHLARLVRLRVGPFRIRDALDLRTLEWVAQHRSWDRVLWPPDFVAAELPAMIARDERAADYADGREWPAAPSERPSAPVCRIYTASGRYLGLARRTHTMRWQPIRGLPQKPLARI